MKSITPLCQWSFDGAHMSTGTKPAEVKKNQHCCGNYSQEHIASVMSGDRHCRPSSLIL